MNNHIDPVVNVMFVEKVLVWNVTSENISTKADDCFGFQVEDINFLTTFKNWKV